MFTTKVSAYIGPNCASSKESSPIGLYYDGYVQVSPGYRYNSQKEYSRGWIRYYEGSVGTHDTGKLYNNTYRGSGIYSRSYRYWDSLNPWPHQLSLDMDLNLDQSIPDRAKF